MLKFSIALLLVLVSLMGFGCTTPSQSMTPNLANNSEKVCFYEGKKFSLNSEFKQSNILKKCTKKADSDEVYWKTIVK